MEKKKHSSFTWTIRWQILRYQSTKDIATNGILIKGETTIYGVGGFTDGEKLGLGKALEHLIPLAVSCIENIDWTVMKLKEMHTLIKQSH